LRQSRLLINCAELVPSVRRVRAGIANLIVPIEIDNSEDRTSSEGPEELFEANWRCTDELRLGLQW